MAISKAQPLVYLPARAESPLYEGSPNSNHAQAWGQNTPLIVELGAGARPALQGHGRTRV